MTTEIANAEEELAKLQDEWGLSDEQTIQKQNALNAIKRARQKATESFYKETGWGIYDARKDYDSAYSTFSEKKRAILSRYNSTSSDYENASKRHDDANFNLHQTEERQKLNVLRVETQNRDAADARAAERDRDEQRKQYAKRLSALEREVATMDEAELRRKLRVAQANAAGAENTHLRAYQLERVGIYESTIKARQERAAQLQLAATNERDWEGGRSTRMLNDILGGAGVNALKGGLNSTELSSLKKGLADATRLQNDAAKELIKYVMEMARSQKNTSATVKQKIDQTLKANF